MNISDILKKGGGKRSRKRRGRGNGSGLGCTSGRGHKGALARSGWSTRYGYEGGQMPLARRLPKRGFSNAVHTRPHDVINVGQLEAAFQNGDTVDLAVLREKLGFNSQFRRLKILGNGELSTKLTVVASKFSASARQKIESAGGTCTTENPKVRRKKSEKRGED
jgi:large subunit ribosomal protein L15